MKILLRILFVYLLIGNNCQSQTKIDSLEHLISTQPNDSNKVKNYYNLSKCYRDSNHVKSMQQAKKAIDLAEQLNLTKLEIRLLNYVGDLNYFISNYNTSFQSYYRAFKLSESIQNEYYIALAYYNLGWVAAIQQGNMEDVHYLYKALKLSQKNEHEKLTMMVYNGLGNYYTTRFQTNSEQPMFDSAIRYFNKGLELNRIKKDYKNSGVFYLNIGQLLQHSKDYKSAIYYYNKAKEILKDTIHIAGCIHKIGMSEAAMGNDKAAYFKFDSVYKMCSRNGLKELKKDVLKDLSDYYYRVNDYKKGFERLKEHYELKEELSNEFNEISLKNLETSYNYERAEINLERLQQANEIEEYRNKRKSMYISILGIIGVIVLFVAYLLYKQNRLKQKTNLQLKEQNRIILEKKEDIEQSIAYAKGIQTSFLPDLELLDIFLPNNFIFYQPKDVVSGDFYWFQTSKDNKQILLACADCTGHGVPGALMSMVGINMLQQFCGVDKLHRPSTILKNLNNEIKNSLKQNSDQNKQRDGMDIALIRLDLKEHKLVYSAANRSLYILRNKEVIELKPTKSAIGGYTQFDQVFDEHEFTLHKGDLVIMTTDGFADQFGGADGKKYMTKKFKDLLISINGLSSKDQHASIQSAFNTWKGNYDQVDDVCVVGINV